MAKLTKWLGFQGTFRSTLVSAQSDQSSLCTQWVGPPWFNYWFSFTLAYSRISHEYSSLFIIVIYWFLCFCFDALTELGAFMRTEFLCISVLSVASGPRVKLASFKSPGGLLYWPFLGGSPGVSLTLFCFVVYSTRRFVLCLTLCHFVLVFFSPFSIAITMYLAWGRES